VLTDNAFAYRHSGQFQAAVAELGAVQRFCRPYHPETNGKVCEDSCWRGTGPGLTLVKV
jgi:transposase